MSSFRFSSITHLHIYAIINTIIRFKLVPAEKKIIRLLDVGCGNGVMLSSLVKELPLKHKDVIFEFFGLDVDDSNVQLKGYFDKTIALLNTTDPGKNWQNHLSLIKSDEAWPFPADYFDLVISNQVLEHVFNQDFLFGEVRRTMKMEGYSFHLFPLRHYIYEGHLQIPFVHKFNSWTTTYYWIKWGIYSGFGTFQKHKRAGLTTSVHEFAERHADYLSFQVNYQTAKQISDTAKRVRLKSSFDFTYLYYKQKLRSIFRLSPIEEYREQDLRSAKNIFYFLFLKYLAGITLLLKKNDSF